MATSNQKLIGVTQPGSALELGAFRLTAVGLTVKGAPSFDEWEKCGAWLKRVEGSVQWWLGDWLNYGEAKYGEKYSQALEATDAEQGTLENYSYVAQNIQISRRREDVSFSVHSEVARLPTAREQDRWLKRAAEEQWSVALLRNALRLAKRQEHFASGDLPAGIFRVVYADPPWSYDDSGVIVSSDAYGRAERHYPTMAIEDIAALPVRERVADDAVLFLWVTSPLLSACWPVIEAWGFEYKTSIVWDKVAHNYGHYVSVRHELLLICTRGSCTPDVPTPMPDSVYVEQRTEGHSEKPAYFRDLIDRLYPLGNAMEVFGRWTPPRGSRWTVYGNQIQTTDRRSA